MTREQIEKAAKEAVQDHFQCNGKYPCEARNYCEFCNGHNSAFDCNEDCGADDFNEGFFVGAEWRINSVWHKKHAVIPDVGRLALLELIDPGSHKIVYKIDIYSGYEWKWLTHYEYSGLIRFAYIDDLLPERKEENNV